MSFLFALGFATALLIGVGCRLLDLPLPAPPRWQGALLVVAMTLGFLLGAHLHGPGAQAPAPDVAGASFPAPPLEPPP
ncbi:hypothetical protein GCM10027359_04920 [Marilutibacter aestuarii]|uniref:XapX domain-containing protein n=1 Tax=Marilutibacter aestuarii TaxID=1706195 RepID=A0A508AEX5_9GAMM|nr:XapX domain-containing protein [Lysobacter aestuarii]